MSSKPCPNCDALGRLTLHQILVARPVGNYSLAGQQPKVSAEEIYVLTCSACEWSIRGRIEGNFFIASA
jgi:hypothetical protein